MSISVYVRETIYKNPALPQNAAIPKKFLKSGEGQPFNRNSKLHSCLGAHLPTIRHLRDFLIPRNF